MPNDPCADDLARVSGQERWPRQLSEMTDLVADAIRGGVDLDPAAVRMVACLVVTRLCTEYGGSAFYVPKSDAIHRAIRDLEIWAAHDGTVDGANGIRALARRYAMSANAIWDILRAQRALHRAFQQPAAPRGRDRF